MRIPLVRLAGARVFRGAAALPAVIAAQMVGRGRRQHLRRALAGGAVLLIVLLVSAIGRYPTTIADTATSWIFGNRTDAMGRPIPQICAPIPQQPITTSAVAAPEAAAQTPTPTELAAPPPPAPAPLAGLDADGRPTPQALAVIGAVPAGADVTVAQGWVLFQLAHPAGSGAHPASADFTAFTTWYNDTAKLLSANASPLDIVTSIDPAADYSPYLLLSQVAAYQMMRQGSVVFTDQQRGALLEQISGTCRGTPSTTH